MRYYIINNGKAVGPLNEEGLVVVGINRQSKVWNEEMEDWTEASNVPELISLLSDETPNQQTEWLVMKNGEKEGPFILEHLKVMDIAPDTLVCRAGHDLWEKACDVPEIAECCNLPKIAEPAPKGTADFRENFMNEVSDTGLKAVLAIIIGAISSWFILGLPVGLGIASLYHASNAKKCLEEGNRAMAVINSKTARVLSIIGLVIALVCVPILILICMSV